MFRGRDTLPPIVLQITGVLSFVFFVIFWAFTGRVAPELLAAAGTLYGTGLVTQAAKTLKGDNRPPTSQQEGER